MNKLISTILDSAKENKCPNCSSENNYIFIDKENDLNLSIDCYICKFYIRYSMIAKKWYINYNVKKSSFHVTNYSSLYEGGKVFSIFDGKNFVFYIENVDFILTKEYIENLLILK